MSNSVPDVVVLGDALLDVMVRPAARVRRGADVAASIHPGPGGQGANLAVRLARRGLAVELVCAVATDAAGTILRDALAAAGVVVTAVRTAVTGSVVILLGADGERTMLSDRVAFADDAAATAVAPSAAWILVSGYLLLEPGAARLVAALAERPAHRVLVGCAVPDAATGTWRAAAARLQPDLVILNADEAAGLDVGGLAPATFVTDPGGATATVDGAVIDARAPAGPPATDTTGAGDAFAAALVADLVRGPWPPPADAVRAALTSAVGAASSVARVLGAQAEATLPA